MNFQGETKGPLLIVIGALHGNEKAGLQAMDLVGKMLEVEPITNPVFDFKGKIVGLIGNIPATNREVRFIDQDLNRMWGKSNLNHIRNKNVESLNTEEKELLGLIRTIEQEIETYLPQELYILDLHTTSSGGGIFAIPNYDKKSLEIAENLHVPVILDMLEGISGTTLHHFNRNLYPDILTTAVTFEAGQHYDYLSVNRCIAAIVNCLISIGIVDREHVENIHDEVLVAYSKNLPKVSKLIYKHDIRPTDRFVMKPGYGNFDAIKKGEILAYDQTGEIKAKESGLVLMPLYQPQGNEGFFIVDPLV